MTKNDPRFGCHYLGLDGGICVNGLYFGCFFLVIDFMIDSLFDLMTEGVTSYNFVKKDPGCSRG